MALLFGSLLRPRRYYGWYGPRFHHHVHMGPMMAGPRMHRPMGGPHMRHGPMGMHRR